jgi:hypothetical protein
MVLEVSGNTERQENKAGKIRMRLGGTKFSIYRQAIKTNI